MRWLNGSTDRFKCRNRKFNSVVAITPLGIDQMAESFDTIFSNITSYKDEIASLKLYPFYIKATDDTPTAQGGQLYSVLKTSKGTELDIHAIRIDEKASIMNIGYISVPHIHNNFLDYNGYTKYSLYLPYFSTIDIDASIFVGNYLIIRLAVDFYTGQGMYIISASTNEPTYVKDSAYYTDGEEVNETFVCNYVFDLGIDIPIGSSNVSDIARNVLLGAIKTTATVAAMAYGMVLPPTTITETYEDISIASSRGDYKGARMIPRSMTESRGSKVTTHNVSKNHLKPISETVSASASILNNNFLQGHGDRPNNAMSMWAYNNIPCLYIYSPIVDNVTEEYKKIKGQPLGLTLKLSQVSGYTTISNILLEGFSTATSEEMSRIERLLAEGVILPKEDTIDFTVNGVDYTTSKGFTWEQFIKTQPTNFRIFGANQKRVYYKNVNTWEYLAVNVDDVIENGEYYE